MALDSLHYVNLSDDGTFKRSGEFQSSPEDIDAIFRHLEESDQDHLVLYFHGGLISEAAGMKGAEELLRSYRDQAGTHPIFFLWESSIPDMLGTLDEIGREFIFYKLFQAVRGVVEQKLVGGIGTRSLDFDLLPTEEFATEEALARLEPVTLEEEEEVQRQLAEDLLFQEEVAAIAGSIEPAAGTSRSLTLDETAESASARTRLSPEILAELQPDMMPGERGLFALPTLALGARAIQVLHRVVRRLRDGTHHGIHCTISEELLRELYVGAIGSWIWEQMKERIRRAFDDNDGLAGNALHGGTYFLERLRDYLAANPSRSLRLSLAGHSAGSIYMCHFIDKAARVLPPEFQFNQVLFMAPGVDFDLFRETVLNRADRIRAFRMFTMRDELEKQDPLIRFEVPIPGRPGETRPVALSALYPHSLLYLVSGLLEGDREKPILGMERFFLPESPHRGETIEAVQRFFQVPGRVIWAITEDGGDGMKCGARSHGGFGSEPATLRSIVHLLQT